ncbi:MAG: hypothetical protein AMXMBFR57_17800 [Acidimicrobiia bacterium]
MTAPDRPKLYHIVHVDRLEFIIADGYLWCDREVERRKPPGTGIGMTDIKTRRLMENQLKSHPGLFVGDCVPFYWCPRSVMLYLIDKGNHPNLQYRGGQDPIVHLVADMHDTVAWAQDHGRKWAFTLSNAGSRYFEDRSDLKRLGEIRWADVSARDWVACKEGKQAEFLIEQSFPWHLVTEIGVKSDQTYKRVLQTIPEGGQRPTVTVRPEWYY